MIQSNHLTWNLFDVLHYKDVDGLNGNPQTLGNPTGCDCQLTHLVTEFTTDANVADRQIFLTMLAQGTVYRIAAPAVTQAASLTYRYIFSIGHVFAASGDGLTHHIPLPSRLRIRQAHILQLDCTLIQATDRFRNTSVIRNAWQTV